MERKATKLSSTRTKYDDEIGCTFLPDLPLDLMDKTRDFRPPDSEEPRESRHFPNLDSPDSKLTIISIHDQLSKKFLSFLERLGCFNFLRAFASI
jgi:hypothetical protein